jgi:hypothetical protein
MKDEGGRMKITELRLNLDYRGSQWRRMKDEGGRMKITELRLNLDYRGSQQRFSQVSHFHPSSFRLHPF